jgi:hypothetical protein
MKMMIWEVMGLVRIMVMSLIQSQNDPRAIQFLIIWKRVQMIHHLRMLGMCLQVLLFLLVDGECGKEKNILTAVSVKHKEIVEDTVRYSSSCFASPSFTPKILEPLFNLVESPMSSVKHGEAYIPIQNTPLEQ